MTSETSENTIFVRFYFTLCYLMLIGKVRSVFSLSYGDLGSRINSCAKYDPEQKQVKLPRERIVTCQPNVLQHGTPLNQVDVELETPLIYGFGSQDSRFSTCHLISEMMPTASHCPFLTEEIGFHKKKKQVQFYNIVIDAKRRLRSVQQRNP